MIRIDKPAAPPEILVREGPRLCSQHTADAEAGRTIEFDRSVYAAPEVKRALSVAQHGKCCYCESNVRATTWGDPEHFRPKASSRQGHEHPLVTPGYYWLAYEWSNLYLACERCNREFKGSLFPLHDPATRRRRPTDPDHEVPIFIDPGHEDPEDYVSFDEAEIFSLDGNIRGDRTIRLLELARAELNIARREHFDPLALHCRLLKSVHDGKQDLTEDEVLGICEILAQATRPSARYTAMMRCHLRRHFGADIRMPLTAADLLVYARGGDLPAAQPSGSIGGSHSASRLSPPG
ncbi:hypothetical protein ACNOYE_35020 [Nannocystaceae bacterium ST9]